MFGSLGAPEIVAILVLALLLFGPKRLPELGRALGKSLAELRKATTDLKTTLEREINESDRAGGPNRDPIGAPEQGRDAPSLPPGEDGGGTPH